MLIALGLAAPSAGGEETRLTLDHPFALLDPDAKSVGSDDFPGKWLLIYFGYTHCADQCPTALSTLAEALEELGPAARHVQPIFITVDPERDRGQLLRDFVSAFDKRLIALTGTQQQIGDIASALGIKFQKVLLDESNYAIDHSSTFSVVDPPRRSVVTFALAEPYIVAAKLFELLDRAGVALGDVKNLGAYR